MNPMKRITTVASALALLLFVSPFDRAKADSTIHGTWHGEIVAGDDTTEIEVVFFGSDNGSLAATIRASEGGRVIFEGALESVTRDGARIHLETSGGASVLDGALMGETIAGAYRNSRGTRGVFELRRGAGSGSVEHSGPDLTIITIHSTALEGNLLGDSADQPVAIYLPPSYRETRARYPVVYLLHGIADSFSSWTESWNVPSMLDRLTASGDIDPMIVVMPNGRNKLMGSFYLNSPVIGGWEDFVGKELVDHVDSNYRTIAAPAGRAVVGHSMGGFGAINFGMRHADRFGIVYAMSPCCLDFAEDIGWGNPSWLRANSFSKLEDLEASLEQGDFYPVAIIALASAFSPNPDRPLFVDLPVRIEGGEMLPSEPTYTKWFDQFPINRLSESRDALKSLKLFAIDYGIDDQFAHIPVATASFVRQLMRYRIPHRLDVYDGDHRSQLPERLETIVFPTISSALSRGPEE